MIIIIRQVREFIVFFQCALLTGKKVAKLSSQTPKGLKSTSHQLISKLKIDFCGVFVIVKF